MSIASSPLRGRVIFVEGAPRSGTTLLVSMLATHPEIAGTVAESHLFDRGVGALFDNHARERPYEGFLSNYVDAEPSSTDLVRELCDGVLDDDAGTGQARSVRGWSRRRRCHASGRGR